MSVFVSRMLKTFARTKRLKGMEESFLCKQSIHQVLYFVQMAAAERITYLYLVAVQFPLVDGGPRHVEGKPIDWSGLASPTCTTDLKKEKLMRSLT